MFVIFSASFFFPLFVFLSVELVLDVCKAFRRFSMGFFDAMLLRLRSSWLLLRRSGDSS